MNIFPNLKEGKWVKVNLNEESKSTILDLTKPRTCRLWVDSVTFNKGAQYSYGGFLEDRSHLWRKHYMKETKAFTHLGIDYNVQADTLVALPAAGTVRHVMHDPDMEGGWGGRILWQLLESKNYLIYGHLKKEINLKIGQICERGDIVGTVGNNLDNGNWFPHLHVQLMDQQFIDSHDNFEKIDGYLQEKHYLLKHVIDPEDLISFR